MFQTAVDIANRALQHIGSLRIASLTENSRQAAEINFCYDKLRRAELRRNVWGFAIREAVLRPVDSAIIQGPAFPNINSPPTPTMFLAPAVWSGAVTYFPGAIVTDSTGLLWMNNTPDNLNNSPGSSNTWDQYFGPLSVNPYDSGSTYFAGELIYNTVGDGVFRTYMSLQNSNIENPTVPTLWDASTFYYKDQVVILYPAWSSVTTYSAGQTVLYTDGNYYTSLVGSNLNSIPSLSPTKWAPIPDRSSVTTGIIEWDVAAAYTAGAFVD